MDGGRTEISAWHARTLVEEHEEGACLFRVRARLRLSFVGTLRGVTLAVLGAGGMSASMFIYDPSVTLLVSAAAIAAIGARAAWQAMRATAALEAAITRVVTGAGLVRLPVSTTVATTTGQIVQPVLQPGIEPTRLQPTDTPVSEFGD
jgi:hypothetical protein